MERSPRARFAPSPSGRMHLGNVFAALLVWLDARATGASLLLRMEDLDRARCRPEYADQLADDLRWLGLFWDEGWQEGESSHLQSARSAHYDQALLQLEAQGLLYPCYCNRRERMDSNAPHRSDGIQLYSGRCRDLSEQARKAFLAEGRRPALRLRLPDAEEGFCDGHYGPYTENLARDCGDVLLRRSDALFAYQLAVVVDDALMGITRVVRGSDLLGSTPQQRWLFRVLGHTPPDYWHLPLLTDEQGRRLSKRDRDLDLGQLRQRYCPEALIGLLAHLAGLQEKPTPVRAEDLVGQFLWEKIPRADIVVDEGLLRALSPNP